jgi:predicted DNA-binding ribbon-helix-helix protein
MASRDGTGLDRRNIMVGGTRTSLALESQLWGAIIDICRREELSIDDFCTLLQAADTGASLASTLRVGVLLYLRTLTDPPSANGMDAVGIEMDGLEVSPRLAYVIKQLAASGDTN